MGWAVEAVADYVENVRPRFGFADHPALWVTERGGRVKPPEINARFVAYRDALGLPKALVPHSLALVRHAISPRTGLTAVSSRTSRARVRLLHGNLHACQRRLHEHCAARALAPALGPARTGRTGLMAAKLDYRWHLRRSWPPRDVLHHRPDGPLADRDITLSSSQVYRLVTERPERLSLKILMALLDILDCTMDDLIEPVAAAGSAGARKKKAAGAEASVGDLRPRRARIHGAGQS